MDEKIEKLNFLGRYLASSRSTEETLEMAMIISQDVLGYDHAMIRLMDGQTLKAVKWIGFPREAADLDIRMGEGISGEVAKTGGSILVEDTQNDVRFLPGVQGCRAELCVPMIYGDKTIGVFNVESDQPGFFTFRDRNILETFASQISASLETARLREELGRAEKLSVVGSLASSILHDIRNDIHRLNICADLLKNKELDGERIAMVSTLVKEAGDNIYGLIEDILEFVKTGKAVMDKKPHRMAPLLASIADQVRSLAPAGVDIGVDADETMELDLDKRKFARALLNLSKNAIEAMPGGGRLDITARRDGELDLIEVRDTGVGIDKERLRHIWEPLYTFGKTRGTGLGMAIVRKIVEDHGWTVEVESKAGAGTVFTITAPAR